MTRAICVPRPFSLRIASTAGPRRLRSRQSDSRETYTLKLRGSPLLSQVLLTDFSCDAGRLAHRYNHLASAAVRNPHPSFPPFGCSPRHCPPATAFPPTLRFSSELSPATLHAVSWPPPWSMMPPPLSDGAGRRPPTPRPATRSPPSPPLPRKIPLPPTPPLHQTLHRDLFLYGGQRGCSYRRCRACRLCCST